MSIKLDTSIPEIKYYHGRVLLSAMGPLAVTNDLWKFAQYLDENGFKVETQTKTELQVLYENPIEFRQCWLDFVANELS